MQKIQSDTINNLRFPLIVAVIFIHSYNSTVSIEGSFPIYQNIQYLISQIIARTAVPLFFFTSGFLFFINTKKWSTDIYKTKLKKRFKSLLIPYVIWITLALLLYFIAQSIPSLSQYFSGAHKLIKNYTIVDFIKSYWSTGINNDTTPFLYPFWFIRDLIIIVTLSPLVYYFVKYLRIYGVLLLMILWLMNMPSVTGLSMHCVFYFTAGAYLSINNLNIIEEFRKINIISMLYPLFIIIDLMTKDMSINMYIHNIGIMIGVIFLFNITSILLKKHYISTSTFLSSASFFVFATHEPCLTLIRKVLIAAIKPANELSYLIVYFVPVITVIIISLIAYKIMHRICPKVLSVISGGR